MYLSLQTADRTSGSAASGWQRHVCLVPFSGPMDPHT